MEDSAIMGTKGLLSMDNAFVKMAIAYVVMMIFLMSAMSLRGKDILAPIREQKGRNVV
jgi:hypothetical protein